LIKNSTQKEEIISMCVLKIKTPNIYKENLNKPTGKDRYLQKTSSSVEYRETAGGPGLQGDQG
jgi:hypothetical protein